VALPLRRITALHAQQAVSYTGRSSHDPVVLLPSVGLQHRVGMVSTSRFSTQKNTMSQCVIIAQ